MENPIIVKCPNCGQSLKVPIKNAIIRITCPICKNTFVSYPEPQHFEQFPKKKTNKIFKIVTLSLIILAVLYLATNYVRYGNPFVFKQTLSESKTLKSNWIKLFYGGLVDKSIITHNGETIGDILKIESLNSSDKGLLQPYMEHYSILCNDVISSLFVHDSIQVTNILNHYPIGSVQPAWVDLFREGHSQIYYNNNLIRLYLKGTNPSKSFQEYQSVVRLPILDIINSDFTSINKVEVYVFNNDYSQRLINLNTIPTVFQVSEIDLKSKKQSLDLVSIESFLQQGVIPEAIEVDKQNRLYLYGLKSHIQKLCGFPLSLSDIAVVYRSIFHCGNNSPYISLDNNEDNRYAKVNFGGHLENTHVGNVVLEADKLFKTLSTGIDPNTHKTLTSKISKYIPGFLTEDERNIIEDIGEEYQQIRYWFYPDSIGTVTDGNIGVVLNNQFLADVERMDVELNVDRATRQTINHLNSNFMSYEKAFSTYEELSNVGRLMALILWLDGMNISDRVELDELLSVKLPAYQTPKVTKKMLAVSSIAYDNQTKLTENNIREYCNSFYLSDMLDKYSKSNSDKFFIKQVETTLDNSDQYIKYPKELNQLELQIDYHENIIDDNEIKLQSLESLINKKKASLNTYSSKDIDEYNYIVDEYNNLIINQEEKINYFNNLVDKYNNLNIRTRYITSIGGGINLRPSEFKQIKNNPNHQKLIDIKEFKVSYKAGSVKLKSDPWIISNPKTFSGAKINPLSKVEIDKEDKVNFIKDEDNIYIKHGDIIPYAKGEVTFNGKVIQFYK
ncbi:MAG: hypothetical protein ISS28_07655 [Candidatus Cloacimonetes bacterium]|nr:hypothetical protein [Candidatus Cloacimonadota bacterium]